MNVAFPYRITGAGRTDTGGDHIRQMIEQVLFTMPGERVNQPDFGAGLMELVFAPEGDEIAGATQMMVQGALQQWLGDVIQVDAVQVERQRGTLGIRVKYLVRRTQQQTTAVYNVELEQL